MCAGAIAIILLPQLVLSAGDIMPVSIICHDLETMEVTWDPVQHVGTNLSLDFRYNQDPMRRCPRYILLGGFTSGCIFPARRALLEIDIRNSNRTLFTRRRLASAYLKPRPLQNVTFHWLHDDVIVTCPALPYGGLIYEVQHRSTRDVEWQSKTATTCNITVGGLDPGRCYDFRVRVTARDSHYGRETHPGDWSHVTSWWATWQADSCPPPAAPPTPPLPLACGLATLLMLLLLLTLLLHLRRVKNVLVPCVPDPRGSFPGLFEKHHGNFQAWIADTQDLSPVAKPEAPTEEENDVIHGKGLEPQVDTAVGSPGLTPRSPVGRDLVFLGGPYMTL